MTATIPTKKVNSNYAVAGRTREAIVAAPEDGVGLEAPLVQARLDFYLNNIKVIL